MSTRYRVTGSQPVEGHRPGDEYSAVYTAERERRLVDGGFVTPVDYDPQGDAGDGGASNDGGVSADDPQEVS